MNAKLIDFNLPGSGFKQGTQLYNVVRIQYPETRFIEEYDAQQLFLAPNDLVILQTPKGPVHAKVVNYPYRAMRPISSLPLILRLATEDDRAQIALNRLKEAEGYKFALGRIKSHNLPMKLVRVQWMHDTTHAIFFYSSPTRVDFRELVRELAHRFRYTRIEMRQIGVRDGTGLVGGLGSCGRELCCSSFLKKFSTISITIAKDQGITLKPQKISGQCGRLMCCLIYEHKIYQKTRRRLPRIGDIVMVEEGEAEILSVDILHQRLHLKVIETGQRSTKSLNEVIIIPQNKLTNPPERVKPTEYIWDQQEMITLID